jgi:RNA methyltransferase, TrmH family
MSLLRSLTQKKVREREMKFVIEGWKSLKDALSSDFKIEFVAMKREYADDPDYASFVREIGKRGIELKDISEVEIKQVSDTVHAQGVLALLRQKTRSIDDVLKTESSLAVFLDRIADPGNMGTIVRTCDWFGVDCLILSEGCVDLYNEKVVRSTSGSVFHIPVVENMETNPTLLQLKERGFQIIAASGDAKISYVEARYKEKKVIVFGNEARGIHSEVHRLADVDVSIPRRGKAESLNVAIACGIILSHLRIRG